ncbi:hypothetical protein ACFC14_02350 [Microbacterium sp. NPDC055988]|uniref:hypothetical protein n=1 Tax=Microbacterium sp. NPDC055988 TaxID=3345671 RepID=UPI0035DD055A
MPFPVYTSAAEWIEVALGFARGFALHDARAAILNRNHLTSEHIRALLTAEAAGANDAGVSTVTPEQLAQATGIDLRDVLLIRAGLFSYGLLSKAAAEADDVQLQIPRAHRPS